MEREHEGKPRDDAGSPAQVGTTTTAEPVLQDGEPDRVEQAPSDGAARQWSWVAPSPMRGAIILRPLLVIAIPIGVVLAYVLLPEPLLATARLEGNAPWCLTKTSATASILRPECPMQAADGGDSQAKPAAPPTTAQLRSRELSARIGLATADAVLRLSSFAAILLAVFALWGMPWRKDRPPAASRLGAIALLGSGVAAGLLAARHELPRDPLRMMLVDGLLGQAQTANVAIAGTTDDLRTAMFWNLSLGYAACGALLALLASLAVPAAGADPARTVPGRLVVLQAAMVVGALLFTAAAYANARLVAWARVFLDQPAMKEAGEALDRLPELWGVLGSALLIAAIGAAYWAIREDGEEAEPGGAAIALRSPDGQDLKFLGWLVNVLLALAPALAALKGTKLLDLPG